MRQGHIHYDADWHFILEGDKRRRLYFERLDQPLGGIDTFDAITVASVLHWMTQPVSQVRVYGPLSATLHRNLDELQYVWSKWRPDLYRRVEFIPEYLVEDSPVGDGAIAAFSGGVDATFTIYRHLLEGEGAHRLPLRQVVMVHGFDIDLDESRMYEQAVHRGEQMLTGLNLPVARVRTNIKVDSEQRWTDAFGLNVAAVLLLFQGEHRYGLLGSSEPYDHLVLPWGSTPVQDWMASTGRMEIRHDGAGYSRSEKAKAISNWSAAMAGLRVCWEGVEQDRNCGRCEKCVRTVFNFRAVGAAVPPAFEHDVSIEDVLALRLGNPALVAEFESVVATAREHRVEGKWLDAVRKMLRRNRRRNRWQPGVRRLRRLVGASLRRLGLRR